MSSGGSWHPDLSEMVHAGGCACLSTASVCPRQGFPLGSPWQARETPLWRALEEDFFFIALTEDISFRGASSTSPAGQVPRWKWVGLGRRVGKLRREPLPRERLGSG
ncbi:hypothetical protein LX36DRAFT_441596 [Colletotrichum falcatum]|nr:hypothetical protein LX36DRAFT_441596 [Colletotrichum falcatum]